MTSRRLSSSVAAALVSAVLVGCGDETPVQEAEEEGGAAAAAILGEPVTIQAEVDEVVGSNAFTVGADETLVIGAEMADAVEEGDQVQVTGTVREFVEADVESDLGIAFDDDESAFVVEYEDELAVVATDVEQLPED